jgi:hypothetical protein
MRPSPIPLRPLERSQYASWPGPDGRSEHCGPRHSVSLAVPVSEITQRIISALMIRWSLPEVLERQVDDYPGRSGQVHSRDTAGSPGRVGTPGLPDTYYL